MPGTGTEELAATTTTTRGAHGHVDRSQVYTLLLQGASREQARMMTAIAQAESARNPGAVGDVALQNGTWGPSVGLFQIRTLKAETGTGSDRDIQRLMNNPAEQVKAAMNISGGGSNYRPWSTYTNGAYRKFLDEPLQAAPRSRRPSAPAPTAPAPTEPVRPRSRENGAGTTAPTRSRWRRCPSPRASRTRTATG